MNFFNLYDIILGVAVANPKLIRLIDQSRKFKINHTQREDTAKIPGHQETSQ